MAKGLIKNTTKQKFVEVTSRMIEERGIENIKLSDVAKEVGCTSAALYRHFDSFDYLTMLSSLRFLDEYMSELSTIMDSETAAIQINLKAWEAFNKYAFKNPPVFLHLFWGPCANLFEDATAEYFQLFPAKHVDASVAYYYLALYTGSMQERDFIWLRKAATEGVLDYDDAIYISKINNYTVHGMLLEHVKDYKEPGVAEAATKECNKLVRKTIYTYVKKSDNPQ